MLLSKTTAVSFKNAVELRWQNAVFDACVSFTFFSKTLEPLVTKNGSMQVNNANFVFFIAKLTYLPFQWRRTPKQALKINFVDLKKDLVVSDKFSLQFACNKHVTRKLFRTQSILAARGRTPFSQHEIWQPLGGSNFLICRT